MGGHGFATGGGKGRRVAIVGLGRRRTDRSVGGRRWADRTRRATRGWHPTPPRQHRRRCWADTGWIWVELARQDSLEILVVRPASFVLVDTRCRPKRAAELGIGTAKFRVCTPHLLGLAGHRLLLLRDCLAVSSHRSALSANPTAHTNQDLRNQRGVAVHSQFQFQRWDTRAQT